MLTDELELYTHELFGLNRVAAFRYLVNGFCAAKHCIGGKFFRRQNLEDLHDKCL